MLTNAVLLAALVGSAIAGPIIVEKREQAVPDCWCLSSEGAQQAADIFQNLIQNYSDELVLSTLTEDFVDYSSAVNIIINRGNPGPKPLVEATFAGRQAFMSAQGSQPEIPFEQLALFHGCNSASLRWVTYRSAAGQETEEEIRLPVVGNAIIEVVPSSPGDAYPFRIKTLYSEFNAAAWLLNLGVFEPGVAMTPPAPEKRSIERDNLI